MPSLSGVASPGPSRRTRIAVVVVLAVIAAGGACALHHHRREQEWLHGGDRVNVSARVIATPPAGLPWALARMGVAPKPTGVSTPQMYVLDVVWDGTPGPGGSYQFILLDGRVAPPQPLRVYGAWPEDGATASVGWGPYNALSEHYPWLARTADRQTPDGWTNDTLAPGLPAAQTGEATLVYWLPRPGLRMTAPVRELLLGMAYVDSDGEVRWAKQVPLENAR